MADAVLSYKGQAEGAILNGSTVAKVNSKPDDGHQDGALAVVVGSLGPFGDVPGEVGLTYCYCVTWMDMLGVPVWVSGSRVRLVKVED